MSVFYTSLCSVQALGMGYRGGLLSGHAGVPVTMARNGQLQEMNNLAGWYIQLGRQGKRRDDQSPDEGRGKLLAQKYSVG